MIERDREVDEHSLELQRIGPEKIRCMKQYLNIIFHLLRYSSSEIHSVDCSNVDRGSFSFSLPPMDLGFLALVVSQSKRNKIQNSRPWGRQNETTLYSSPRIVNAQFTNINTLVANRYFPCCPKAIHHILMNFSTRDFVLTSFRIRGKDNM